MVKIFKNVLLIDIIIFLLSREMEYADLKLHTVSPENQKTLVIMINVSTSAHLDCKISVERSACQLTRAR